MSISSAVSDSARSAVVGYQITKGNYALSSPNLPQRIAILSEANTDHQTGLDLTPFQANSASDVATRLGAGSPGYLAMRILQPLNGGGLSGIPIWVYPMATVFSSTATVVTVAISGTATSNATHKLMIAGRTNVDGQPYSVSISKGDTGSVIASKYASVINAVYGSPATAGATSGSLAITSKVKGTTSIFYCIPITESNTAGISYAITTVAGTLMGNVSSALSNFQRDWNTIVINPYNDATSLSSLEAFNGKPDPINPTGRYSAIVFKPFVALYSVQDNDPQQGEGPDIATRLNECTNAYCPAPNTFITPIEVAANMASLVAQIAQNTPNLDVNDLAYPDAPTYGALGNYYDYSYRDNCVKSGISTVDQSGSNLIVKDLITTYNPVNEVIPQFRYVRNLMLDFNAYYAYNILEQIHVVGKTLVLDGTIVEAGNTISPSEWKGILNSYFKDMVSRGLFADADFCMAGLKVGISASNPDRFETFYPYQRTGIARICSTTAQAGFYFGN